jgi:hypothetical protein
VDGKNQLRRLSAQQTATILKKTKASSNNNYIKMNYIKEPDEDLNLIRNIGDIDKFPVVIKTTTSSYEFIDD